MTTSDLFGPMFSTAEMRRLTSDSAWLQTMLDVEAALARSCSRAGLVPPGAAEIIAACCDVYRFDIAAIGRDAASGGNPVIPMVEALVASVPTEAARWVHFGATSQDILDTAAMLVVRGALDLLLADLEHAATACAALAEAHAETVMAARTLLQQAVPTTFGLKAAGWLMGLAEAREGLVRVREGRLAVQLGGAAGTLAVFGQSGVAVLDAFAAELELPAPAGPWHTNRVRMAEIAAAMSIAAGACAKIGLDVALLMQTEVGEAFEPAAPGKGRSSAMPHKRNPVGAVAINACARQAQSFAALLMGCMAQEHERAVGAWQAEWTTLNGLLNCTAGAVSNTATVLEGLEVDTERMRGNLEAAGGMAAAERLMTVLAERIGRLQAQSALRTAVSVARSQEISLADALAMDREVGASLSTAEVNAALDPLSAVGNARALIDRALAAWHERE